MAGYRILGTEVSADEYRQFLSIALGLKEVPLVYANTPGPRKGHRTSYQRHIEGGSPAAVSGAARTLCGRAYLNWDKAGDDPYFWDGLCLRCGDLWWSRLPLGEGQELLKLVRTVQGLQRA